MITVKLAAAFLLVGINAFFVLAEFAVVKVRATRLEELAKQGSGTAKATLNIVHNLDSYLSAIQLGITVASLALGWLGEPAIARLITPIVIKITGSNMILVHTVSVVTAFTIITVMHVVLGELIPKSIAIQKAERMSLLISQPLTLFYKLVYPMVYIFDHIAIFCLKLIGITPGENHAETHTEEELRMIVSTSHSGGILSDTKGQILDNVFSFSDKNVREIMTPRTDMICLYLDESYENNMKVILESAFTRFPLCRADKDNIIGMIHMKDILENETRETPLINLKNLMREILFVPGTMNISNLMQLMRKRHIHLATVIDEYGGTAGLISLEDVLEEIVGDIHDEYDVMELPDIREIEPSVYEISGQASQTDVKKVLKIDLNSQDDETIGGYVFSLLGRKPELGDAVSFDGYTFEVTALDHIRIDKLRVFPANNETNDEKQGQRNE
ncbi:MAG: hemolysin family protein [Deferribacteraceae bacterium]|jgi:CBS domain containing-hemolysin-like protein|nr:hemolysin family protein [Deferribacteraceae bacterium]